MANKLKSRTTYRDGTVVEKKYHFDGSTSSMTTTSKNGQCEITEWHQNKVKKYLRSNNIECGWYDNGNMSFTREYLGNNRHGESLSWYSDNSPMSKQVYVNDSLHGLSETWNSKGGHTKEMWVNGKRHGFSEWWSTPRFIYIDKVHLNNVTYCVTAWYEDKCLTTTFHHSDGEYVHTYS